MKNLAKKNILKIKPYKPGKPIEEVKREFGLKDVDYWVFGLLGMMGVILFLLKDARFLPVVVGIFGFLAVVGLFLLVAFRREIRSNLKAYILSIRSRLRRRK